MIDGTFEHSDSNGGGGVITNGDTQWMTAGAGILHIEKPPEALVVSGGLFHGFQLWVNLPRAQKWAAPRYQDLRAREVALVSSSDGGALVRVIAGDVAGACRPRLDLFADDARPRDPEPGRPALDPVARRLQRAGLRDGRLRHGRRRGEPDPDRAAGRLRPRHRAHRRRRTLPGGPEPEPGRPAPGRTTDPRAGRLDGPVRHEHARRGHAGVRGLPGGATRQHPGGPRRSTTRRPPWSSREGAARAAGRNLASCRATVSAEPGSPAVPARRALGRFAPRPRSAAVAGQPSAASAAWSSAAWVRSQRRWAT